MSRREEVECSACHGTGNKGGKPLDAEDAVACAKCQGRGFFNMADAKAAPPPPAAESEPVTEGAYAPPTVAAVPETAPALIVLYSIGVQFIKSPAVAPGTLLAINPADGKTRVIS